MFGQTIIRQCLECNKKTEFDVSIYFMNTDSRETYYEEKHKCSCGFVFNPSDVENIKKYKEKLAVVMS